jgi:hypothetical protein
MLMSAKQYLADNILSQDYSMQVFGRSAGDCVCILRRVFYGACDRRKAAS